MRNVTKQQIAKLLVDKADSETRDEMVFNIQAQTLASSVSVMAFTDPVKTISLVKDLAKELETALEAFDNKTARLKEDAEEVLKDGIQLVAPLAEV